MRGRCDKDMWRNSWRARPVLTPHSSSIQEGTEVVPSTKAAPAAAPRRRSSRMGDQWHPGRPPLPARRDLPSGPGKGPGGALLPLWSGPKRCPVVGCDERIDPSRLMCRRDWYLVPHEIRGRIWATWRSGEAPSASGTRRPSIRQSPLPTLSGRPSATDARASHIRRVSKWFPAHWVRCRPRHYRVFMVVGQGQLRHRLRN
jgi:hypothetical protein